MPMLELPLLPSWLKLLRIGLYVVSALVMLIHLAGFSDEQRERHHKALSAFANAVKTRSVVLFEALLLSARVCRAALAALYGATFPRRVGVSAVLSLAYLTVAGAILLSSVPDLVHIRGEKAKLEKDLNPFLKYSQAEILRAREQRAEGFKDSTRWVYVNNDVVSRKIRIEIDAFDSTWQTALARHSSAAELGLITLLDGHPNDPGIAAGAVFSVFASNVLLDLLSLMAILAVLSRMEKSRSSAVFAGWTILCAAVAAVFGIVALFCSSYFLRGAHGAYVTVLVKLPAGSFLAVLGLYGLLRVASATIRGEHEFEAPVMTAVWSVAFGYLGLYLLWSGGSLLKDLGMPVLRPPSLDHAAPWVLAAACVGPTLLVLLVVGGAWLIRIGGGLILRPFLTYLTVALRANRNLCIGLFALPALVVQAIYSLWEYLAVAPGPPP